MKKFFFIIMFLIGGLAYSQTGERTLVQGTISVPPGDDPEGIGIINETSNKATVSNSIGQFQLELAVGDTVVFTALQFQEFTVVIDANVIEAQELNVIVREAMTELPEVVVSPTDLSGNVEVDVRRIADTAANIPDFTEQELYNASLNLPPDALTTPENIAMRTSFMENGLNFANIFRAIWSSRDVGETELKPLDKELRQLYDDEFFREYLNIDRSRITEFIYYAEDHGLSEDMIREGNELELIEFLIEQGKEFKNQ